MPTTVTEHDAAAAHLIDLLNRRYALTRESAEHARAGTLTGAFIDTVLAAGADLDRAAEEFRRRFYPRTFRVAVAGGQVMTVSRTARSIRTVWWDESA